VIPGYALRGRELRWPIAAERRALRVLSEGGAHPRFLVKRQYASLPTTMAKRVQISSTKAVPPTSESSMSLM